MTVGSEGQVINPQQANLPVGGGPNVPPTQGRQGEYLTSEWRGKFGVAAQNKGAFWFNVTAVTIPAIASNLVSVFSLWNPPASGVLAELIDAEIGQVLATTVVDAVGWYFSSGSQALAGTFTTKAVANTGYGSARVGDTPANQAIPYTAYTHSGTPVRCDIICSFGATSDAVVFGQNKIYDGKMLVPPGTVISAAMSTAASTTSGLDLSCRWMEIPFTA